MGGGRFGAERRLDRQVGLGTPDGCDLRRGRRVGDDGICVFKELIVATMDGGQVKALVAFPEVLAGLFAAEIGDGLEELVVVTCVAGVPGWQDD